MDLFRDRARHQGQPVAGSDDDAGAVADVCRRLDGLLLAIELAAARSRILSASQIAHRLDDRYALLSAGDSGDRHASLQAAVDWSHDLLREPEQIVFRRLGVFAGSFDIDAAEAVCVDPSIPRAGVLNAIDELVRQSLVVVLPGRKATGLTRYRLLETIREYAHARLDDAGELPGMIGRQAAHLLTIAHAVRSRLTGPDHHEAISTFNLEADNLLATIDLAARLGLRARALDLCATLWPAWTALGRFAEGARRLELALSSDAAADAVLAEALTGAATLHVRLGNLDLATAHAERARVLAPDR